jgi:predicted Zn-dependent peptidase
MKEVDFAPTSILVQVAPQQVHSKYSGRVLELMADGALNPVFTQAEFDKEKQTY